MTILSRMIHTSNLIQKSHQTTLFRCRPSANNLVYIYIPSPWFKQSFSSLHATTETFISGQWPRWNTARFIKEWQTDTWWGLNVKAIMVSCIREWKSASSPISGSSTGLFRHLRQDILAPWTATHVQPNYLDSYRRMESLTSTGDPQGLVLTQWDSDLSWRI